MRCEVALLVPTTVYPRQLGLITIRREGKLYLPGAKQRFNETWQQAARRGTMEETGVNCDVRAMSLLSAETVHARKVNLLIALAAETERQQSFDADGFVVLTDIAEAALPQHEAAIKTYFAGAPR